MKSNRFCKLCLITSLLILAGATDILAQGTTYTTVGTPSGNWSTATNWAGGVAPTGNQAGNLAVSGANSGSIGMTLDVATTIGQVKVTAGSDRHFYITNGGVAMTFDNTGGAANLNGDLNAAIESSSSGANYFYPNIIIQNTDLEILQTGSTSNPGGALGASVGSSTITATSPRNLILIQNEAKAGQHLFTINNSIGATGSMITISNMGPGTGPFELTGVIGPNATIVENSTNYSGLAASTLELANSGNNYTGPTIITNGTLQLLAANAIPPTSTVTIYGTNSDATGVLLLGGFSDTIGALNGNGVVVGASSGTPTETLTVGGGNSSGTFIGTISNMVGTLSFAKTGSGTEILSGTNYYSGTTTFGGGFLQAGSPSTPGVSGPFGTGTLVFSGGGLQYSAANQQDYSSRISTAASQPIAIDVAGQSITFATALTSSGGSLSVTDSVGGGTLNLTAAETYSGATTIDGGTLELTGAGALSANSSIIIGVGGTFNVSGFSSSTYTLGTGALDASGYGTSGSTAATIVAAPGGTFDLGAGPLALTWNGAASGADSAHPCLVVSGGTLQFSGNGIDVVVPGTALGAGTYTLISAASISGTPDSTPVYTGGNGVAPGNTGTISVSGNSVILTVVSSGAVVGTWTDASGTDNNWTTAANWSGGVPQLAGSSATFGAVTSPVVLNAGETVGILSFTNPGNYTISGANTLSWNNSGAGATVKISGGTNTIQTPVFLDDSSGNTTITANSGTKLALSGNVSGVTTNETLLLNGAGTTALSGNNTYGPLSGTVGTALAGGGTLQVGSSTALGKGDLNVTANDTLQAGAANVNVTNNIVLTPGAALTVDNNGDNLALDGTISGNAGLTEIGSGTLTLNGTNTYFGDTYVDAGVLSLSSESNVEDSASIILNGGDLLARSSFSLSNSIGIGPATGLAGGTGLIDAASGQTFLVAGVIASAGNAGNDNLTLNSEGGTGEIILSNANTFNGTTVVSNGTLDVASMSALMNSSFNNSMGTLVFDASLTSATFGGLTGTKPMILTNLQGQGVMLTVGGNGAAVNYNTITDEGLGGSLAKDGAGEMTVTNANFTGNLNLNQGSLTILNGSVGSPTSTITTGAGDGGTTLTVTNNVTLTAEKVDNGLSGGSTGCAIYILGAASANFDFNSGDFQEGLGQPANVQLGGGGDTSGPMVIDTTGTVALGNFVGSKDSSAPPSTQSGLVISNGTVTATSVTISTANSGADLNIYGGSLTITTTNSSEDLVIGDGSSARGGWLSMFGGSLTYLGQNDGLLLTPNPADEGEVNISGGIATLSGIYLDASDSDDLNTNNPCLSLTGGALYLGSFGLVNGNPTQTTNEVVLGGGILGAFTNWDASTVNYIFLTNTATIQAADASGKPWNIELDGQLSGPGTLVKTGNGTLLLTSSLLSSSELYSGNTIINAGTLALADSAAIPNSPNIVIAGGATFDVSGLSSPLALNSSQVISNSSSTALIGGNANLSQGTLALTYASGVPSLSCTNGMLTLAASTGLQINNLGAALPAGTYTLITNTIGGSVVGTVPSSFIVTGGGIAAGATNSLEIIGGALNLVVTTTAPPPQPTIKHVTFSGGNIIFSGTNNSGPGGAYQVLTSTNLTVPLNSWTVLTNGTFDGNGDFSITNSIGTTNTRQFYLLQVP